jgi:hypothetical protein
MLLINESDNELNINNVMDAFCNTCLGLDFDFDTLAEYEFLSVLYFVEMYGNEPKELVKKFIYGNARQSKKYGNACYKANTTKYKYMHEIRSNYVRLMITIIPELSGLHDLCVSQSQELHFMYNICREYALLKRIRLPFHNESVASLMIKIYGVQI